MSKFFEPPYERQEVKSAFDFWTYFWETATMSRPLRIQYRDAWYHVMNLGRRGERVFETNKDYWSFIHLPGELHEVFNFRIAAYCLMPNHYHLLVQTVYSTEIRMSNP